MFIARDNDAPRKAPDAFFPAWSRGWVVALGVALIVVGALATALVLYYLPPFAEREGSGSDRLSFALLAVAVVTFGYGVVCLFRKPTAGSMPGSEKYERLIAKEGRDRANYVRRRITSSLMIAPLAFGAVLVVRLFEQPRPGISGLFWIAGAITVVMGVVGVFLWRQDRRRERSSDQDSTSR